MTTLKGQLSTVESICRFMFAGKATITLRSLKSGARFTYRIKESDDGKCHFVSLLHGPDNEGDFIYLGHFRGGSYSHGRKSTVGINAPGSRAFEWFAANLLKNVLPANLEVWHEGKCGHCGHKLTVPESCLTGFGPDCSEKLGIPRVQCEDVGVSLDETFGLGEERSTRDTGNLVTFRPHPTVLASKRRYPSK